VEPRNLGRLRYGFTPTRPQIENCWSPEEMHAQHPHLSLAEIHAALSYYYLHQAKFDTEIERQRKEYEAWRAAAQNDPLQRRLRELALQREAQ
jgi:hypothetical protein